MNKKYVLLSFLLLFVCLFGAFTQDDDTWYYGKPIRDVKFEGLENVALADVTAVTNRYIGKEFPKHSRSSSACGKTCSEGLFLQSGISAGKL